MVKLRPHYHYLRNSFNQKRLKEKLVIIESDDWGSIRVSSKGALSNLKKKGYPVSGCSFNKYDGLESDLDLEYLFEVLASVKGANGNCAILTANNIVGNPDFEKIQQSNFTEYFFEPFFETYKRYMQHSNVMNLYKSGIENKVILPQFHGREHVNVFNWMSDLKKGNKYAHDTFNNQMFSTYLGNGSSCRKEYLNSMAYDNEESKKLVINSIIEGLDLFEAIWGFRSETIIAPCYEWNPDIEETFNNLGIKLIQGGRAQIVPFANGNKIINHYNGKRNDLGQIYVVRNIQFEPATNFQKDWVNDSLCSISNSFLWKQPAIISSHRLNYIGWLNQKNRDFGLKTLSDLLKQIVRRWPDVNFISSNQLIKYYN